MKKSVLADVSTDFIREKHNDCANRVIIDPSKMEECHMRVHSRDRPMLQKSEYSSQHNKRIL